MAKVTKLKTDELTPCPFCKGKAEVELLSTGFGALGYSDTWQVKCLKCGATFGQPFESAFHREDDGTVVFTMDGRADAIAAWNTRAETKVRKEET